MVSAMPPAMAPKQRRALALEQKRLELAFQRDDGDGDDRHDRRAHRHDHIGRDLARPFGKFHEQGHEGIAGHSEQGPENYD